MKNRFLQFVLIVILSGFGAGFLTANAQQNEGNNSISAVEYFAKLRNNQYSNSISAMDLYNADKQVAAMKQDKSDFSWDFVGPSNMSGLVRSLLVDNQDPSGNTLYAGSIEGGLWKSTNNGDLWEAIVTDKKLNVSSICQAPNGTIYVATGVNIEPYKNEFDMGDSYGQGIYKSTDGNNFSLMEGTVPASYDVEADWMFIYKLAADANNNVYAATNTGLKYYNGNAWVAATAAGETLTGIVYDVVAQNNIVITAVGNITYLSSTGYNGFANITGEDSHLLPVGKTYHNAKFDIANANENYIYALFITNKGRLASVYLSKDKGVNWAVVHPGYSNNSNSPDPIYGDGSGNSPSYGRSHCAILANPLDANRVYVGGKVTFEGSSLGSGYYSWTQKTNHDISSTPGHNNVYLHIGISNIYDNPIKNTDLYFTTDGGVSCSTDNLTTTNAINRYLSNSMYFTINTGKKGEVIAGSYLNGVHYIDDNTAQQAVEMLNKSKSGGIIPSSKNGGTNHISFINPNFVVCSSTGDKALWRSEDKGANVEAYTADIFDHDFITPFIMWESKLANFAKDSMDYTPAVDIPADSTVIIRSRNASVPFYHTATQEIPAGDTIRVLNPIVSRTFAATKRGIYMNTNVLDYSKKPNKDDWWKISNSPDGNPTCIALSQNSDVAWVGTDEGKAYRISNLRAAYNKATATIGDSLCVVEVIEIEMGEQAITTISVDPQNSDNVVIGYGNYGNSNYIQVSTNANANTPTFSNAQGNLPTIPVYASIFECNNNGMVFLGTDKGLYYTNDIFAGNVNWTKDNGVFGDVKVTAINQQNKNWGYYSVPEFGYVDEGANNYGTIYIATFGNSIYKTNHFVGISEFSDANSLDDNQLTVYPNPATDQAFVKFNTKHIGKALVQVYDVTGKLVYQQDQLLTPNENTIELNTQALNNGMYIVYVNDGAQKRHTKLMINK